MSNRYNLVATDGALSFKRTWVDESGGRLRPPGGGGGARAGLPGRSTAGRVSKTFSARSRRTMRFQFSALPWEMLGKRPVMITLTYPGDWELWVANSRELAKHREAFKERWRRKFGTLVGVWVVEFQRRGAPHLHLYVGLPDEVSDEEYRGLQARTMRRRRRESDVGKYEARKRERAPTGEFAMWLRTAWWEVVGSELQAHHGRGIDIAVSYFSSEAESMAQRAKTAEYFWRESGKWAQKNPPEGFGSLRFYGRWGQKVGFNPLVTEHELDEQTSLELRRMLRRLQQQKMRELAEKTGRKFNKRAGGSRGRDGLTVFDVDGRRVAAQLLECATVVALDKAAGRSLPSVSPTHPRALSERPVTVHDLLREARRLVGEATDEGPPFDAFDDMPQDQREMLEADAYFEAQYREEQEIEEAIYRHEVRSWGQERARERDRKRYRRNRATGAGDGAGASPPDPGSEA